MGLQMVSQVFRLPQVFRWLNIDPKAFLKWPTKILPSVPMYIFE